MLRKNTGSELTQTVASVSISQVDMINAFFNKEV
jgi:hypothetical protein